MSEQYREQAKRYDQEEGLDQITDDYINSFKKEVSDLQDLLDRKDSQVSELMHKVEGLKAYAESLKADLEAKYNAEGSVMPRELQDAPEALSPRKDAQGIADELRKAGEKRSEILQNGRIEQLEAENEMLKEQVKAGIKSDDNGFGQRAAEAQAELLANAEEKARLL